jgi:hypothetical protein
MGERRWTRGRIALVVLAAVVVVVAVIAAVVWPRDTTEVVSVDEAVDNFRNSTMPSETSTPASEAPPASAPTMTAADTVSATSEPAVTLTLAEPGVYRYTTSGWEDIDALSGARHDYPAETTITVTADGCGVRLRWDALRERRDEWRLCITDRGIELQPDGIQYHEFFQQPELEHVECDRSVVVVPIGDPPAEPVVQSCLLEGDPWSPMWTAVERTERDIDGTPVPVWHVRMTVDDNDDYWEHTTTDWFLDDQGLPVGATSTKESNSPSPVGDVRYRESYELSAESLTPLR